MIENKQMQILSLLLKTPFLHSFESAASSSSLAENISRYQRFAREITEAEHQVAIYLRTGNESVIEDSNPRR